MQPQAKDRLRRINFACRVHAGLGDTVLINREGSGVLSQGFIGKLPSKIKI